MLYPAFIPYDSFCMEIKCYSVMGNECIAIISCI